MVAISSMLSYPESLIANIIVEFGENWSTMFITWSNASSFWALVNGITDGPRLSHAGEPQMKIDKKTYCSVR